MQHHGFGSFPWKDPFARYKQLILRSSLGIPGPSSACRWRGHTKAWAVEPLWRSGGPSAGVRARTKPYPRHDLTAPDCRSSQTPLAPTTPGRFEGSPISRVWVYLFEGPDSRVQHSPEPCGQPVPNNL